MPIISVTLGASATAVIPGVPPTSSAPCESFCTIQNNSAAVCAVGEAGVTLATGILLAAGVPSTTPGGSLTLMGHIDLSKLFIVGTAASVVTVMYQ